MSGEPGHPVLLVETQQKGLLVEKQKRAGNVVLAASWRWRLSLFLVQLAPGNSSAHWQLQLSVAPWHFMLP